MKTRKTLERQMTARIARKKSDVFVRDDFTDLGGYDQVGRGLRNLVAKQQLIKVGYGLYARAAQSPLTGRTVPRVGLREIACQALDRLNVKTASSSYERAYNEGRTTQIPTGRVIGVKGRISRKIGYDGKYVTFERTGSSTRSTYRS
jgi:hypothetical protein